MHNIPNKTLNVFKKVFSYTPECASVVIAGGAVVNLAGASDIDLWFLNNHMDRAKDYLAALPYSSSLYCQYASTGTLIGEGYIPDVRLPIQVLVSHHKTAQDLIDSFDISSHAYALVSKKLQVVQSIHAPSESVYVNRPEVIMANACGKTLGRYVKICNRYGYGIADSVVRNLSDKFNTKQDAKSIPLAQLQMSQYAPKETLYFLNASNALKSFSSPTVNIKGAPIVYPLTWDSETATTKTDEDTSF